MKSRLVVWALFAVALPHVASAQAPLRFVGDRDYPPLSFIQDGQPRGFDVELLQAIGKKLGREVRIDLLEWADAQRAVINGDADGLTDLAISDDRRATFDFAEPTVTHTFGLFVRAGDTATGSLDGVVGKTVGVTQGGFPREFFSKRPDVRLVIIANYIDGFDRLQAGAIDAVAADIWPGALTVEQRGLTGVALGGEPFALLPASIAVVHANAALLADINRAVRDLRADGTLQKIEQRWRPQQMVFLSRKRVLDVVAWTIGGLLGTLLIAVSIWALTLRKEVRVRRAVEGKLADSGQRLGLALAAANMGTWQWNADTDLETRDGNLNRILGLDAVESTQPIDDLLDRVHPDDRDGLRGLFTVGASDTFTRVFRVICADGTERTLRGQGKVVCDEHGVPQYSTGVAVDITTATEALARGHLLTHALQGASDCIVITDASRHILYTNDAFRRTFGYDEAEVIGRHVSMLHPTATQQTVPAEEADGWRGEQLNRTKDGRVFPVSLAMSVVRGPRNAIVAVVGVARDISAERTAQDALRESESKFSRIFEYSPDAIALVELSNESFLMVNEAFEKITGFTRVEASGRTAVELGLFNDVALRSEVIARFRRDGVYRDVEYQIRRKSGETATVLSSGAELELGGKRCRLTVSRDISEQKRFEMHLRQAAEANKLLLAEMDLDGLSRAVVESVHKILPLDSASLVLKDLESGALSVQARQVLEGHDPSPDVALGLAAEAVKAGELRLLVGSNPEPVGPDARGPLAASVPSVCALPLATARRTLGALVVGTDRASSFSDDHLTLLAQFSTYAAIALQNARAFEAVNARSDQLSLEKLYLQEEIRLEQNFSDIVGESRAITRVLRQIETVARTDASVLILGETGTGKELLARAIYQLSTRKDRAFVKVNAAALPAPLLESELFGYERGAFTGATTSKMGRMEVANRGTLFLDEVGDMPLEMQPKLLRVLQEREFERLGSNRTLKADVRLIAATNRDLQEMVDHGAFRSDLFYRLNVFPIHVPPLRARREDIPPLVRYFVQKLSTRMRRQITTIPAATMAMLQEWEWPGNIRELENVVERAVILSKGEVLEVPTFQPRAVETPPTPPAFAAAASPGASNVIFGTLAEGERAVILRALRDSGGVISGSEGAAARLGLKRTTLQSKMRKLGIRRPGF